MLGADHEVSRFLVAHGARASAVAESPKCDALTAPVALAKFAGTGGADAGGNLCSLKA